MNFLKKLFYYYYYYYYYYYLLLLLFYIFISFFIKIALIFSCSGMFRNHQCSVFRVLSTALNVNSIKQQSSSQNVHKLFMLVRKLLFLSQLTTKNSLLQTLHGGKMNRKKR